MNFRSWTLNKWNSINDEWNRKTPKQKWQSFYNIGKKSGYMTGLRFFGDAKVYLHSYVLVLIVGIYLALAAYTVGYHKIHGRLGDGLSCLSISGIYIMVRVK